MDDNTLPLAADENLDQRIIDGLRLRNTKLDIISVTGAGLRAATDPQVLDWAARQGRVLLTHDRQTMPEYTFLRIAEGKSTPGVIIIPQKLSIGEAIEEILLIAETSAASEWVDRVIYLPL